MSNTLRTALDALPLPRKPDLIRFSEHDVRAHGDACARLALERAVALCEVTPPYPFRPSIEAAHAIRELLKDLGND